MKQVQTLPKSIDDDDLTSVNSQTPWKASWRKPASIFVLPVGLAQMFSLVFEDRTTAACLSKMGILGDYRWLSYTFENHT